MKIKSVSLLVAACVLGCAALFQPHQTVTATLSTNTVGVVVTNYVTNVVEIPNPNVTVAIDTAREVSGLLPPPWSSIMTGVLGLATVVLGIFARVKTKQAALVPALILGIEKAAANQSVKTAVKEVATDAGVQTELHAFVQKLTEK